MSDVQIAVCGVTHTFADDRRTVLALDNVDLEVRRGEFLAVIGPSGCGKTTLFNLVSGLYQASQGEVTVFGEAPTIGNPRLGYLFARDALLPWRTALGNVELSLESRGVRKKERRERAREMLEAVGLGAAFNAYPAELSQGMRQRVAIARTLVAKPDILLMDEPFSALDAQTRLAVQDVFIELWQRTGSTVVLITHDLGEAVSLADRIAVMGKSPGRIKTVFDVAIERPRNIGDIQSDDRYHRTYSDVWTALRDEFYDDAHAALAATSQEG